MQSVSTQLLSQREGLLMEGWRSVCARPASAIKGLRLTSMSKNLPSEGRHPQATPAMLSSSVGALRCMGYVDLDISDICLKDLRCVRI